MRERGSARAAPFFLLLWDLQPFAPSDTLDPLVVHMPARVAQQARHHAGTIAPVLIGQFDDVVSQSFLIGPAQRNFALRGSVLPKCPTGPALGHAKLTPHMVDALSATRRAQNELVQRQVRYRVPQPSNLFLKLFQPRKLPSLHTAIKHPPSVKRLLRHADLAHRLGNRRTLSLQHFNMPKFRYDLFGLLSFSNHR